MLAGVLWVLMLGASASGWRYRVVVYLFICLLAPAPAHAGGLGTARYDSCIRSAASTWWLAGPDWLWWRAQLYQESRLDPTAESPVGARGLAQFMPGTWGDVTRAMGWGLASRDDACLSAEAGAFYMARLQRSWSTPRPQMERHRLAQASYNAGLGNILGAQRACGGARDWGEIAPCLPGITGRHARETLDYVDRIAGWRAQMEALR